MNVECAILFYHSLKVAFQGKGPHTLGNMLLATLLQATCCIVYNGFLQVEQHVAKNRRAFYSGQHVASPHQR